MKKILSAVLCALLVLTCVAFAACSNTPAEESKPAEPTAYGFTGEKDLAKTGTVDTVAADVNVTGDPSAVKIGLILVGDATEGYTKAHMDGIKGAAQALGISDSQLLWKYKVEESEAVTEAGKQLITEGCTYIFSNSYGHQDYMAALAKDYPNVHFVAMTGDTAATANYVCTVSGCDETANVTASVDPAALPVKDCLDDQNVTVTASVAAAVSLDGEAHNAQKNVTVTAYGSHDFSILVETVPATCNEGGYDIYKCSRCDATINLNETAIDPDNHAWSDWTETAPATCTGTGSQKRTCSRCDMVETEEIPALPVYTVTQGAGGSWTQGSGTDYVITVTSTWSPSFTISLSFVMENPIAS